MELHIPKLIYLISKKPSLTAAEFAARWRAHGDLATRNPRWRHVALYSQCDVVDDVRHDGVGVVWYKSFAARAEGLAETTSQQIMEADEREIFSSLTSEVSFISEEPADFQHPDARAKVFRFVSKETEFGDSRDVGLMGDSIASSIRWVWNTVIDKEPALRGPRLWAGVEEWSFLTIDEALEARDVLVRSGVERDGAQVMAAVVNWLYPKTFAS
ncbi:hypothetical protein [Agrobacterium sp. NPDC090283]|uniref:hypothetical protein n=1 Tax=Agrobacterium sp. NPDC090283 TaxID=3363920 RepID=UPI00383B42A2